MRTQQRLSAFRAIVLGIAALITTAAAGQSNTTLTVAQAVEAALGNYPAITVSQEQISAATAGIQLARTAYLPHVESMALLNRGTRNNVFGLLFPQGVFPSISGPVLGSNNFGTVWGSAIGALVTWEPFDFGLRTAGVSAAGLSRTRAEATLKRTQFDIAVATADTYLTLAAAQETVRAAQAGVDRADVLGRTVRAQVDAQLRPGADSSRAEAELAAARTQLVQAQQGTEVARALLAQFIGTEPQQITIAAAKLLQLPPEETMPLPEMTRNPIAAEQNAVVEQARSQLKILERSYFPRFLAQGSAYARGSGAQLDGIRLGGLNGLLPDTQNYALGFSVTFPVLDLASIRARQAIQSAAIRTETARYKQITTDLTGKRNVALATLDGSRRVAANTPTQVSAADAATRQASARYEAGLGTIIELADAQRLLTQAEIDDALARLGVWRALLGVAAADGDIQPFLARASQ